MEARIENLQIIERLIGLAKNPVNWELFPKDHKDEHVYLSLFLTPALEEAEYKLKEKLAQAVGHYKVNLADQGKGWFHSPENLCWAALRVNQLKYAIYGDRYTLKELSFNKKAENPYEDLIKQIDPSALMSATELREHQERCNKMAKDVLAEILAEQKAEEDKKKSQK